MNKDELVEKIDLQKKYASKIVRIVVLPLFGYAGFGIFALKELSFVHKYKIFFSSYYLFIAFLVIGLIFWLLSRNMRKIGLVCSNCQIILDRDLQQTALTTLKCGKCGEIIITENSTSQ